MAAFAGSAFAEPGPTASTYKQVTFKAQGVAVDKLIAAAQMTKDQESPARAFTGPTSMAANPDNPRIVVAATADLRSKTCYLAVSKDAGQTWHFSKEPPPTRPTPSARTPRPAHPTLRWRGAENGTLYYAHMAYGDGEGPREGKSSAMLARTTDLGASWKTTLVETTGARPECRRPSARYQA